MIAGWLRSGGLTRRVAVWTSATALLGIASFAAAMYGVLLFEAADEGDATVYGEPLEEELGEGILWAMLIAAPPSVLVAIGGTTWVSRRAFAPLREVTRAATEITYVDLGRRLELTDGDLRELVTAFNDLLERLEGNVEALDRYAADVSHEIRTPLAVAIVELEVSLRQPRSVEHWEQQAQRTLDDLRQLANLTDALLQLARSTADIGVPRARMDVLELLEPLLERTRSEAERAGVSFELHVPTSEQGLKVAGSAPLLRGAIANILDNALRHAGRPGRVCVTITADARALWIAVDDSGPGIPEHERARVFQPFVRGKPIDADAPGFGLGLAVAWRVVSAHGGTVVAGSSAQLGGASLLVELPRARA